MKTRIAAAILLAALAVSAVAFAVSRRPAGVQPIGRAERVLVDKSDRELMLFRGAHRIKTYKIALGPNPEGHKQHEGDGRTPEGRYVIDFRKRDSAFHRALHVSYPNAEDLRRARRRGVAPGGAIMIHGLPNGASAIGSAHRLRDWTQGCIAVTNEEIEEIWGAIPDGTPIQIKP